MSHLTLETLARLVDESGDPTENGHLDICEQCRTELEALRADANALRMLPDPEPPIAAWLALEQQLKREGIMRRSPWVAHSMRMAATLAIFVLGTVAGMLYMRKQQPTLATSTPAVTGEPLNVAQTPVHVDTPPTTLVNSPIINAAPRPAANAEEATTRLRQAERDYLAALTRFTEFTTRAESGDPVARLAALESIVATTRAALGQAPADPVINGYHLTAVAQRDATLRQIASKQQTWY
ncbi:MAG TPA: hypothetical protein VM100_06090 [Longimicrobiales bacterium]|nr:hypothetical protein [Longimicrobiales bacterium]